MYYTTQSKIRTLKNNTDTDFMLYILSKKVDVAGFLLVKDLLQFDCRKRPLILRILGGR